MKTTHSLLIAAIALGVYTGGVYAADNTVSINESQQASTQSYLLLAQAHNHDDDHQHQGDHEHEGEHDHEGDHEHGEHGHNHEASETEAFYGDAAESTDADKAAKEHHEHEGNEHHDHAHDEGEHAHQH